MANEIDFEQLKKDLQDAVNDSLSDEDIRALRNNVLENAPHPEKAPAEKKSFLDEDAIRAAIMGNAPENAAPENVPEQGSGKTETNPESTDGGTAVSGGENASGGENGSDGENAFNGEPVSDGGNASEEEFDPAEEIVAVTDEALTPEIVLNEDGTGVVSGSEEAAGESETEQTAGAEEPEAAEDDPLARQVRAAFEEDEIPLAYDKDELLAAVIASQEHTARETEKQAIDEVNKAKRRAKRRRTAGKLGITIGLLAILAAVVGGAYTYMSRFYETHFFTGSTVNGKDVSGLTAAEVKKDLFSVADTYQLTIKERGGKTETLTSEQLGRSYIDNSQVEKLLEEQENEKWIFSLKADKEYEVTFDMAYDKGAAKKAIDNLQCFTAPDITAPRDAKLSTDTDGTYVIIPEEMGNTLEVEKAKELIYEALDKGAESVDFEEADLYIKPEVYSDDERLNKRMNAWNSYLSVNVTYHFGDNTETINAETIRPYITDNGYDVILATDWVKTLVYGWGQKYDTFGLEREFTTHDGVTIKIPAGGDYGWCINKDKTIEDVTNCILNGESGDRDPVWLFEAMGWDNNDLTGTYCEVSIKDQHLWCYKNGQMIMETDVVTGKPTAERQTITGCFAIDGKKKDAVLGRLDVQGYASPVSWWLPFNGGQGLHDAPWRSNFGNDVYLTNGSHGCVNIPEDKMETIFNALEIGNAVIVYDEKVPIS